MICPALRSRVGILLPVSHQQLRPHVNSRRWQSVLTCAGVANGDFVAMSFQGKDDEGAIVLSSDQSGLVGYMYEVGNMQECPKGLQDLVIGMEPGSTRSARAEPADALGEREEAMVLKVKKTAGFEEAQVGGMARVNAGSSTFVVKVLEVGEDEVTIDANNPLAGKHITFEASVESVVKAENTEKVTFAAGCFWGPELVFQRLPGVVKTNVGYSNGQAKEPRYEEVCKGTTGHAEVVQVVYDKSAVSFIELMEAFWGALKDPTNGEGQGNDMGSQYRPAVFFHSDEQQAAAMAFMEGKKSTIEGEIAVEVSAVDNYHVAEPYHQQYLSRADTTSRPQSAEKGCADPVRCYG